MAQNAFAAETEDEAAATETEAKADEKATDEKADEKDAAEETESKDAEADEKDADDADEADDAKAEAGALADGTYEASGKGIGGDVPVTVTIKDGAIESVEVGDNSETQGIGSNAIEQLPEQFVGLKTAEEVDALDGVSGATITSNALKTAVADCLEQASAGDAEATDEADEADDAKAEAGALADGTYEASGKGIGGDVPVTVTIKDGAIESVEVGDNSETQGIGSNAIEQLPEQFVGLKTAEEVDALDGVSGATITSNALKTAVADCLEQASAGDAEATDEADEADADKADEKDADAEDEKADEEKTDEKASSTDKADADEDAEADAEADEK